MRRVRQRRQRLREALSSQLRRCAPLAIPVDWCWKFSRALRERSVLCYGVCV